MLEKFCQESETELFKSLEKLKESQLGCRELIEFKEYKTQLEDLKETYNKVFFIKTILILDNENLEKELIESKKREQKRKLGEEFEIAAKRPKTECLIRKRGTSRQRFPT